MTLQIYWKNIKAHYHLLIKISNYSDLYYRYTVCIVFCGSIKILETLIRAVASGSLNYGCEYHVTILHWNISQKHQLLNKESSEHCLILIRRSREVWPWCSLTGRVLCSTCSWASSLDTPSRCGAPVHWLSSALYRKDTGWSWSHSYPRGWPAGDWQTHFFNTCSSV